MYWFTPTISAVLIVALALAVASLATSYAYSLTIALVVVVTLGVVLGIVELNLPKAKAQGGRGFHMPAGATLYAPTDVPEPPPDIVWPKNL